MPLPNLLLIMFLLATAAHAQQQDPTRPPPTVAQSSPALSSPAQEMKVTGIIRRNGQHLALVGQQVVGPGDNLGNLLIVAINENGLILRDQDKDITLMLDVTQHMSKSEANGF